MEQCSTWGQWGAEDELGALNYIGPKQVVRAVQTVREGLVVSLALPFDDTGPQNGGRRPNPKLLMTMTGTDHINGRQTGSSGQPLPDGFGVGDDFVVMPTQSGTHVDGLAHIYWQGRMYNGKPAAGVTTSGAATCGIEGAAARMVTRGVLLDAARHFGRPLSPGRALGPDDLQAIADEEGLEVTEGDCLLIRTGFLATRRGQWDDFAGGDAPGLSLRSAPWLHDKKVAIVASDTWGVEVRPNEISMYQPLHLVSLVYGGIHLAELFDLESLATECQRLNRWEFLFVAAPLPLTGACGSPLNPLAIL
jgi:kynurenine formamidase